jgi:hypothetical protein
MSLSKLPNELVSMILSFLELDGLLQASAANKLVHSLSKPFLELAFKYRCIQLGAGSVRCKPCVAEWPKFPTAAMFLKEIFEKPQITHYVTHISNGVNWDERGSVIGYEASEECLAEAKALAEAHKGFECLLQSKTGPPL